MVRYNFHRITLIAALFSFYNLLAQDSARTISTEPIAIRNLEYKITKFNPSIEEVIVYPDQAMVTRKAKISIQPGRQILRFENGSIQIEPNSLRAFSSSNDCIVHGITSTVERVVSTPLAQLKELEDKLMKIEYARDNHLKRNERYRYDLQNIENYSKYLSHVVSESSTKTKINENAETWKESLSALSTRRDSIKSKLQSTDEEITKMNDEIKIINGNINKIRSAGDKKSRVIEVNVQSLTGKETTISLSYVIKGASWSVSYGMHLAKNGSVQIDYYGNIVQTTGEDWNQVTASLSTSSPSRGAQRSKVTPMQVSAREISPQIEYVQTQSIAQQNVDDLSVDETAEESPIPTTGSTDVSSTGESYLFKIPQKVTAPSIQRAHRVTIAQFEEKPKEVFYRLVPSIQQSTHLAAIIPNKRDFPLMAGRVDSFRDSGFTGRSTIEFTPSGQSFLVGFGADRSVAVKRNVSTKRETVGTISSDIYYFTDIIVEISNPSNEKKKVSTYERIPVSEIEDVKVEQMEETTPGSVVENPGILRWDINLEPKSKQTIRLRYRVRVPKNYPGSVYGN
ncbi:mucoidy inhibitor MuiA family protein [Leptospira sp. GIMC2001]|uniref:mucoidy inhibitor MuiA family protein n=1 Tax=Leptospira sp. GIMC2001 TaxID=1513297 RepID=UPI002349D703|nr:mucoidy inhibitor MuiA family protein [Leptospira sp. GIMC2001]WCL49380.1 mucoidy inhibitor MuiA family protein [Leptospira sp. GIMC2001]